MTLIRSGDDASRRARARAAVVRATVIAVVLVIALLAAGVPARLLMPADWPRLAHDVHRGLRTLASTLWPYSGHSSWARLDLLLVLAVVPVAAAAVGFWPAERSTPAAGIRLRIRRLGALALLLALYVVGVLDSSRGSATVEGVLLLALVVGWLWLPGLRARRVVAAIAWLVTAGAVAAFLAADLAGNQPWIDYRAWDLLGAGDVSVAFSWDQTYGPIRWSRSQRAMFIVHAAGSQLWKVTTLDRFDGLRFVRSGANATGKGDLPLPLNDSWYAFATFTVQGLASDLLPTEQGTTEGVNFGHPARYYPDGTVSTEGRAVRSGDTYTVLSYVPQPTPAELRSAPHAFPTAYLRYTEFDLPTSRQSGLRLAATDPAQPGRFFTGRTVAGGRPGLSPAAAPSVRRWILASPYAPLYRLARHLASGTHSAYDVALATEAYLKSNYAYSEQPPARRYPLESFLFADRVGYCQQFSGAMALMLRMDGIPARVAAGFLPGSYDSATRSYQVRAVDAHSWVEVYFAGIGWVPFDPTPPRSDANKHLFPGYVTPGSASETPALSAKNGGLTSAARLAAIAGRSAAQHSAAGSHAAWIALALAMLPALLAVAARWLYGRARLRRSLDGDGELATAELARALSRLGYVVPATVTLAQIERLVRVHGGPEAAMYVRLLRARRYANTNGSTVTLRERRRLRYGLTAHLGFDARLRGHWALPPGTIAWRL
jgi:transglutaminase-like putative cysteine protease